MDRDEIFFEKYLGNAYESCICTGQIRPTEEIVGITTEDGDFITSEDDQILIIE